MPTTSRRFYSNTALPAILASAVDATQTTLPVSTVTGLPTSFPFSYVLDRNAPGNIEVVEVQSLVGTTLTVIRGVDGTSGKTHASGAPAEHASVGRDFDTTNAHASSASVSGAHGAVVQADVTGGYVDLFSAQTIAGAKTLSALLTASAGVNVTGALNVGGVAAVLTNDARLSDARPASGGAGGDLAGSYPSPTLSDVGMSRAFRSITPHGTGDFNAHTDYGPRFVQGSTNGPGITGAAQYYNFAIGLGAPYTYADYAMQWAVPRMASGGDHPYLSFRQREAGAWGSWLKVAAGYADTAGSVPASPRAGTWAFIEQGQ